MKELELLLGIHQIELLLLIAIRVEESTYALLQILIAILNNSRSEGAQPFVPMSTAASAWYTDEHNVALGAFYLKFVAVAS